MKNHYDIPMVLKLFKKNRTDQEADKARLEAFIDAFPGEYCGLTASNHITYSDGFCALMGLERISSFDDIQACLMPGDSAALEGLYERLFKHATTFTLQAETLTKTKIKITGSLGRDAHLKEKTTVLWVEKQTEEASEAVPEAASQDTEKHIVSDFADHAVDELQQVQTALNSIARPLWLRDTQQKIVWCNSTYAEYLGLEVGEVLAQQKEITSSSSRSKTKAKEEKLLVLSSPKKPSKPQALWKPEPAACFKASAS